MSFPGHVTRGTRTEFGVRYPDKHVEFLASLDGVTPGLPNHARERGGVLVQRNVTTTEWATVADWVAAP